MERIYAEWTKNLQDAEWKLNDLFPEDNRIYCGLCSTCDKRIASRNQCLDKGCFAAKVEWSHQRYLEQASFVSGIKVVDAMKGGYTTNITGPYFTRILETKCENLCLEYGYGLEASNSVAGFPQARIRCDKRNDSCTCLKGLEIGGKEVDRETRKQVEREEVDRGAVDREAVNGYETDERITEPAPELVNGSQPAKVTAADLEEIARQARQARRDVFAHLESARDLLARRLAEDFANLKPGAFYAAARGYWYPKHEEIVLEKIFGCMGKDLANRILPTNPDNVDDLERRINNILEGLELEPINLRDKPLVESLWDVNGVVDPVAVNG